MKGNFYPLDYGKISGEDQRPAPVVRRDVLLEELGGEDDKPDSDTDVSFEERAARRNADVARGEEKYGHLSDEELRQKIFEKRTQPWGLLITIDERNLPVSITPLTNPLKETAQEEIGGSSHFRYERKISHDS